MGAVVALYGYKWGVTGYIALEFEKDKDGRKLGDKWDVNERMMDLPPGSSTWQA